MYEKLYTKMSKPGVYSFMTSEMCMVYVVHLPKRENPSNEIYFLPGRIQVRCGYPKVEFEQITKDIRSKSPVTKKDFFT